MSLRVTSPLVDVLRLGWRNWRSSNKRMQAVRRALQRRALSDLSRMGYNRPPVARETRIP